MALWPGQKVKLVGIKAPGLNGLQGKVLALDKSTGRWRVDLGGSHGVKALKEENLVPSGGSESAKQDNVKPGDLISSLLGDDDLNSEDSDDLDSVQQDLNEEPWKPGDADHKKMEEEIDHRKNDDVATEADLRTPDEQVKSGEDQSRKGAKVDTSSGLDEGTPSVSCEQDELSKLTVKELKQRLTAANVSILGVTEKSELIALIRKHPSAPSLSSSDASRPKAGASSAPNKDANVATKFSSSSIYAQPGKPWEVSGAAARPPAPGLPPGYGPPPGYAPPPGYGPPPGYPTQWGPPGWNSFQPAPPSSFYAPFMGPFGYAPPPTQFPALIPRDQAKERAKARIAQQKHSKSMLERIANFVRDRKLPSELETGLQMAQPQVVQYILTLSFPPGSYGPIMSELRRADPETEGILRSLLQKEGSRSSSPSSRGRRKKKKSGEKRKRSRKRKRQTDDKNGTVTEQPAGVWDSPERGDENAGQAGASEDHGGDIREWLLQLDQGRGALECYLEPLCAEFQNLDAVKEMVLSSPLNSSIIGKIDPSLWKALGEPKLGHKMLLSKGIVALVA